MNRGTLTLSIVFLLVALAGGLVLIFDLSQRYAAEALSEETPASASAVGLSAPTVDGVVSDGEYVHRFRDEETGMDLYWSVLGEEIYFALRSPGKGWLAVGFDPDGPMMRGADIIIGFVQDDGETVVRDHYADTQVDHKPDSELGGTEDITEFAGSEDAQGTTLEFVRPLQTEDAYDKAIRPGEMFVLFAYAPEADDFIRYHGQKNRSTRSLDFFAEASAAAGAETGTGAGAAAPLPEGPPTLDGVLAEGEYAAVFRDEETGMELHWTIVGEKIYLGLRSPGSGWVAVGFAPEGPMMKGADILIGYVQNGEAFVEDNFADGPVNHKPDSELGGTDNVEEFAGSEGADGTILELVRPLNTGDPYDRPLTPGEGEVTLLLAYAEKDDFISYHAKRASVTLDLAAGVIEP